MAGIWKRGNYWRAEIRRRGFPLQNRTFDTKADAEAWARRIETEMDRGCFVNRAESERNMLPAMDPYRLLVPASRRFLIFRCVSRVAFRASKHSEGEEARLCR